jgi:hypothetical protein
MTKVIFDISMSLDGYMTAANARPEEPMGDDGQRLHEWAFGGDERNRGLLAEAAGFALGRVGWRFFVIIPGVAVSGLVAGHPTGEPQGGLQAGPRGVRQVPRGVRA